MNILKVYKFLPVLVLVALVAGACTFPVTMSDDFTINFGNSDLPNGAVIPFGETRVLSAYGQSTGTPVTRTLFFANGLVVGESRNRLTGGDFDGRAPWTPAEPGLVTLQAAAQRRGGYGFSETITVCVLPIIRQAGFQEETWQIHYEGDCTLPERSPTAVPGPVAMTASATPESLTFVPWELDFVESCTRSSLIYFEARVSDPPDDVANVTVSTQVSPAYGSWVNSDATVVLNHTGDEAPHTKIFTGSYDSSRNLQISLQVHPANITESGGVITWTARAFARDGENLAEVGPFTIPAEPVHCDGSAYVVSPASSPAEEPMPLPASALDCPAGTYFAEVTKRCIPILIVTPRTDSGGDNGDNACVKPANCQSWDPVKCVCN